MGTRNIPNGLSPILEAIVSGPAAVAALHRNTNISLIGFYFLFEF